MPLATRSGSQTSGGYGAPVVNVVQDRSSSQWIQIAVLGSLTLQTVLVALLAFSLMGRGSSEADAKLAATRETVDVIAKQLGQDKDFTKDLTEARQQRDTFETLLEATADDKKQYDADVKSLKKSLEESKQETKKAEDKALERSDALETARSRIKQLTAQLNEKGEDESTGFDWKSPWLWTVIATSVAVVLAGVLIFRANRPTEDFSENPLSPPTEPPAAESDDFKEPPDATNTK